MGRTFLATVALLALYVPLAYGQEADSVVGNFMVHQEKDKFDDSTTVIAFALSGDDGLILRCIQGTRNVAVAIGSGGTWARGDLGKIKVKVDSKPVQQFDVGALNEKLLELHDSETLIDVIRNAGEVDVRIAINDISHDYSFKISQSGKVVDIVNKGCGVAG